VGGGPSGPTVVASARKVLGVRDAVQIVDGCALRANGHVVCWGNNSFGEAGAGTLEPVYAPTDVGLEGVTQIASGETHACALHADGRVACWGLNTWGQLGDGTRVQRTRPVGVFGLVHAAQVAAGGTHTCVRT